MIEIDKYYFSAISKLVNDNSYNQVRLNYLSKNGLPNHITDLKSDIFVKNALEDDGFAVIEIDEHLESDPTTVGCFLEKLFGEPLLDNNPGKFLYAKIQAEDNGKYYINSNMAQPMHTDQGHTTQYPRYAALYCLRQSQIGGDSVIVPFKPLYTKLLNYFPDMIEMLFLKDCLTVLNVNGKEQKPIFLRLDNGDVGISYSPVLQKMWCTDAVFRIFDFITSYVHDVKNQIRLKLEEGQVLLIDNSRALHGRTAFSKVSNRLLFRYWFGNRDV